MKSILIIFIITLILLSCTKELSKEEQYNKETYLLLNSGYTSIYDYTHNTILDKPVNLLKTNKIYLKRTDSLLKEEYCLKTGDSLYQKKWDKSKLIYFNTLNSDLLIELDSINNKMDSLCDLNQFDKARNIYPLYKKLWKQKIKKPVTYLSYPKFNIDYTKALLFYDVRTDPNENYGCFIHNLILFEKKNNKWMVVNPDVSNYGFKK